MGISAHQGVAALVVTHPLALPILHAFDVDLGLASRTLAACCGEHAVDVDDAIIAIEAAEAAVSAAWRGHAITELLDHVVDAYHRPCAHELDEMASVLEAARSVSRYTGWATPLARLSELRADLEQHIEIEDRVVFPWVRGSVGVTVASIRAIQLDNADAMANVLEIEARTEHCIAIDRDNTLIARVREQLRRFERWLSEHIHFETNELFPRVLHAARP